MDEHSLSAPTLAYRQRLGNSIARRAVDIFVAGLALLLTSPVLMVAACAIMTEDQGSVLFVQRRVGRFGELFSLYKLRTMKPEYCGDAAAPSTKSDPRVTRVGRFLRKTSIDELPQLLNVLRGDMTLVGPRPEMPFIVKQYLPWQQLRLLAVPGITGLWQVTCRSTVPLHRPEATLLDIEYIRTASPLADSLILLRTVGAVLSPRGAY